MKYQIKVFNHYFRTIGKGDRFLDKLALAWFTAKTPIHFIMHKLYVAHSYKLIKDVWLDLGYKVSCGTSISNVYMVTDDFEDFMMRHIKLDKGTFIDIGANVGKWSLRLAHKGKGNVKVIAIEPECNNFSNLVKSIKANEFQDIIKPLQVACSDVNGLATFNLDNPDNGTGTHSMVVKRQYNSYSVPCMTLDYIVEHFHARDIKLIKIDVEGVEPQVLKGAINTLNKFKPKIVFEAWNDKILNDIRKVIEPLGYVISRINEENYYATI